MLTRRTFTLMLAGSGVAITVAGSAQAAEAEVRIDPVEVKFDPETITIKAGDTITWTNTQLVSHDVTFDPAKARNKENVILPPGVAPFSSGELKQDQTFQHTFTTKGRYKYVCSLHEEMKMWGFVEVA